MGVIMKLDTEARKAIPASKFALPGRRFPIEDRAHAANAKARATQGVERGTLSESDAEKIRRKANRMLAKKG